MESTNFDLTWIMAEIVDNFTRFYVWLTSHSITVGTFTVTFFDLAITLTVLTAVYMCFVPWWGGLYDEETGGIYEDDEE